MKDVPRVFEYMKSTNVGEDLIANAALYEDDPDIKEYAAEEPLEGEAAKEEDEYIR